MTSRRVRAVCLKKTKLGETDLIVTMLAADGCQVRAVAKGARKPGSRLGGRVEPFTELDVLLHSGRSLDIISDAEIVVARSALREDYDRSVAAAVVADFLDKVSQECQTEDRLFALTGVTLDAMEVADGRALTALVVAFLLKGMAMHGYRPQFGACAGCGVAVPADGVFALESGGPACDGCATGLGQAVALSHGAHEALARLMGARMADVGGLGLAPDAIEHALEITRAFVVFHIPARLKALGLYR